MELAGYLGRTLEELEDMPHHEYVEWRAAATFRPLGQSRLDVLAAVCTARIVAAWGGNKDTLNPVPDWATFGLENEPIRPNDYPSLEALAAELCGPKSEGGPGGV